ncbi:hypothetical protein [Hydrogenimonas sp.]
MRQTLTEILINFLLGAAWAIALLGAVYLFWSFLPFGILFASMAALVGSLFGLLMVVFLELAALQFQKYREMKRQTHLLESIRKELHDAPIRDH